MCLFKFLRLFFLLAFLFTGTDALTIIKDFSQTYYDISQKTIPGSTVHKVRIFHELDKYYFPPHFYNPPFSAIVEQIDYQDYSEIENIIDDVLNDYKIDLKRIIDGIYVADSYKIYGRSFDVFLLGRNLYVAYKKGGEKIPASTIIEKLHGEIHVVIYDYYQSFLVKKGWFPEPQFSMNYPYDTLKNQPIDEINSAGFINYKSIKSSKVDFVQTGHYYRLKRSELNDLQANYASIEDKVRRYESIINLLSENTECESKELSLRTDQFYQKHKIKVEVCNSLTTYPRIWTKKGWVYSTKLSTENSLILIEKVDRLFMGLQSFPVNSFLKEVNLVADLSFKGKMQNIVRDRNEIYIGLSLDSENLTLEETIDSIIKDLSFAIAELIRINFHYLFPSEAWANLKEIKDYEEIEFFFNDKFNKEILEYFANEILLSSNYSHLVFPGHKNPAKREFIKGFFSDIESWVKYIDDDKENFLSQISGINEKFGIDIHWKYDPLNPEFILPSTFWIQDTILYIQAYRVLKLIPMFLNAYPEEFIKNNLNAIVLASSMNYVNSNEDIGGTYESVSKAIFISNFGNEDSWTEGTLHHEFGHMLLDKYKKHVDFDKWINANGEDFQYNVQGLNPESYAFEKGEKYFEKGFVNNQSTKSFDEDFVEFFKLYQMDRENLLQLSEKYEGLKTKYLVIDEFVKVISSY